MKDRTLEHFGRIETAFASGPMPIERGYLDRLLVRFLAEMDVWAAGGSVAEGIRVKRRMMDPQVIYFTESGDMVSAAFTPEVINARAGMFAHLKLTGAMIQEDFISTRGVQSLAADIRTASDSPNIDGILLELNTGGGEMLAGQTLRNAIKDAKKPVLVYGHFVASAGIWGTVFADHIMAAGKASEFGSIGVYTSVSRGFLDAYKEKVIDVYSRKSPNKNKDFRSLLGGDFSALEESVTEADEIFMSEVKRNRPLAGDIDNTLAGGIFFAEEAKRRGLVDSIGTFSDAVAQLGRMVRAKKIDSMSKTISFKNLAQKFLGVSVETEEAAVEALEGATPQDNTASTEKTDLAEALAAVNQKLEELGEKVLAVTALAESLREDLTAFQENREEVEMPDLEAVVRTAIEELRAEVGAELSAMKVGKSGKVEVVDEGPRIGKAKEEGPVIDLLAPMKEKGKVQILRHLS